MKRNDAKQFNRLLKKIALGNKNSLEMLYRIYGKFIYSSAIVITKSSFFADEVVNDVLVKVWKNSPYLSDIENPLGWLYTMTTNSAKDRIKSEKQVLPLDETAANKPNSENVFDLIANADEFYSLIFCLDEREQQIMIYRFVEDLSFKSISKIMQMPTGTVTTTYYRALKKIRKNNFT